MADGALRARARLGRPRQVPRWSRRRLFFDFSRTPGLHVDGRADQDATRGLAGGLPGRANAGVIRYPDGQRQPLAKATGLTIPKGSVYELRCGGGGGYGPPAERDPGAGARRPPRGLHHRGARARALPARVRTRWPATIRTFTARRRWKRPCGELADASARRRRGARRLHVDHARAVAGRAVEGALRLAAGPRRVARVSRDGNPVGSAHVCRTRSCGGSRAERPPRRTARAAARSANRAIRNVATLGGNLCSTPFPASDVVPALIASEAIDRDRGIVGHRRALISRSSSNRAALGRSGS